ncbi:lysoplasmalogenase [Streptomyces catenulae]|uniref:Lysoplasmalogenase n=1 Tax=Streptomyces catenulae TaxID=66875 RepID=A0ABV2Z7F5_9ACTN|nr:lysoplasmalogenase [Streptomyces catenulae]
MNPTRPRPRAARVLLVVFAVLAAVHLVALLVRTATGSGGAHAVADAAVLATKPALMPVLAGYALTRGGPPLLAGALLFGCCGDTLLQIGGDLLFLLGMAAFAAGHVCYLVVFARRGTAPARSRTAAAAAVYVLAWGTLVALLWPGLPADLRGPVAGYSLLLTGMAFGSLRIGPLAAVGGLLFLLSDTLIATGIADWPQAPAPQFWVMLTYIAAQSALALGLLRTAGNPAPAAPATARPVQV